MSYREGTEGPDNFEAAADAGGMNMSHTLAGQLLVAMPGMLDPNFDHTVTYICEHSSHGALGIVINRPLELDLGEVFSQLSLKTGNPRLRAQPVLQGGPVQVDRGFVLHESKHAWEATTPVSPTICVTTSRDILSDVAAGKGPERIVVALGYSGWGAGQLESELMDNAWLTVPASSALIFDTPYELRWKAAAESIGVDPASLSLHAGTA